jgi:DNA-directed RNA polymerase subunit H (RpoH/RPB5)
VIARNAKIAKESKLKNETLPRINADDRGYGNVHHGDTETRRTPSKHGGTEEAEKTPLKKLTADER